MTPSVFDIVFIAVATMWVPIAGLLLVARRRENARAARLLEEATGRAQLHHISRGRRR